MIRHALKRVPDGGGARSVGAREGWYAAEPTALALAARRVAPENAAAALREARYPAEEAVPALVVAYRLETAAASVPLRDAGYAIDDAARGLSRVRGARASDVVTSLRMADYDSDDLRRVSIQVLMIPADEYAGIMKEAGARRPGAEGRLRPRRGAGR